MSEHPSAMALDDLRDACLIGAECLYDPELHDGPGPEAEPEEPHVREAREAVAKEVCASCPVAAACLEYAERTRPTRGIWAGFTAEQLQELISFRRWCMDMARSEPSEAA